jgi:hypothetical protein
MSLEIQAGFSPWRNAETKSAFLGVRFQEPMTRNAFIVTNPSELAENATLQDGCMEKVNLMMKSLLSNFEN